jgi:hypothetical protein
MMSDGCWVATYRGLLMRVVCRMYILQLLQKHISNSTADDVLW